MIKDHCKYYHKGQSCWGECQYSPFTEQITFCPPHCRKKQYLLEITVICFLRFQLFYGCAGSAQSMVRGCHVEVEKPRNLLISFLFVSAVFLCLTLFFQFFSDSHTSSLGKDLVSYSSLSFHVFL